jgi:anti-anti-sigma regulatory factor
MGHRIALSGEATVYHAADIRQTLIAAPAEHPSGLDIDLSAVTEIDSAGVQLLMAAKQALGSALTLSAHSVPVLEVFELFALGAFFGDPLVMPA